MHPINAAFEKVFVLTIERNKDRHPQVEKNLQGIGFDYWYGNDIAKMFPGVAYVHELPEDFLKQHNTDYVVTAYTKGQFGAYLSIKQMIEYIAENNIRSALIFEDDFTPLKKNWQQHLLKAVKELPEDWHLLLAGYNYNGTLYRLNYSRLLRPLVRLLSKRKTAGRYSAHLDRPGICFGGHAYCVSKRGADYLCTYFNPMKLTGDMLHAELIKEGKINAFAVYPNLFRQDTDKFPSKTMVL